MTSSNHGNVIWKSGCFLDQLIFICPNNFFYQLVQCIENENGIWTVLDLFLGWVLLSTWFHGIFVLSKDQLRCLINDIPHIIPHMKAVKWGSNYNDELDFNPIENNTTRKESHRN